MSLAKLIITLFFLGVLAAIWGIIVLVYGSQVIGFITVMALLSSLGFACGISLASSGLASIMIQRCLGHTFCRLPAFAACFVDDGWRYVVDAVPLGYELHGQFRLLPGPAYLVEQVVWFDLD